MKATISLRLICAPLLDRAVPGPHDPFPATAWIGCTGQATFRTVATHDRVRLAGRRPALTYLRPEVQLLHKAPGLRAKDQADFEACAHLLEPAARAWLRSALETAHPGHPWVRDLS